MPPDLNSLPPSSSSPMSSSPAQQTRATPIPPAPRRDTPSPRASSTSLAAAASMNAADLSRRSSASNRGSSSPHLGRAAERRRSQVAMNINLNDPALPSPGELSSSDPRTHSLGLGHSFSSASPSSIGGTRTVANGDPHHQRTPSLGEIHQELEQEQEAQVNRMLQMIREQQQRLDQMRMQQTTTATGDQSSQPAIVDDLTPSSERSFTPRIPSTQQRSTSRSPALRALDHHHHHQEPTSPLLSESARRNSATLLRGDESAYYQAETASLTRENQMLRVRVRELERQVAELNGRSFGYVGSGGGRERQGSIPAVPSPLVGGVVEGEGEKR